MKEYISKVKKEEFCYWHNILNEDYKIRAFYILINDKIGQMNRKPMADRLLRWSLAEYRICEYSAQWFPLGVEFRIFILVD